MFSSFTTSPLTTSPFTAPRFTTMPIMWWLAGLTIALAASCTLGSSNPDVETASSTSATSTSAVSTSAVSTNSTPEEATAGHVGTATVVEVVDGDTIVVLVDGTEERVRLIGIDTPETGECLHDEATRSLTTLLQSGTVELALDTTDRDRFDRLLRYVWANDVLVNEAQVAGGLAIARRYPPDVAMAERFEAAESDAKAAAVGRWAQAACGELATSTDGSPTALRIAHIEFDAPGDDSKALNGEWVRIVNEGAASVQLEGWQLRDDSATHRFTFPPLELAPNATISIFSGCGNDTSGELFWCNRTSAVWNNGGDTAFLIDPSGNTITSFTY